MNDSAALYQLLFQHEMLFQVAEPIPVEEIEVPTVCEESAPESTLPLPVLTRRVAVLIENVPPSGLQPADALLLENILKATGHTLAETDVLALDAAFPAADARATLSAASPTQYVIVFSTLPGKFLAELTLSAYIPRRVGDQWYIQAEPLAVIDKDKNKKKQLWLALKEMFSVS